MVASDRRRDNYRRLQHDSVVAKLRRGCLLGLVVLDGSERTVYAVGVLRAATSGVLLLLQVGSVGYGRVRSGAIIGWVISSSGARIRRIVGRACDSARRLVNTRVD
jgi:hypothetical protein